MGKRMVEKKQTKDGETIYIYNEKEHQQSKDALSFCEYIKKELKKL